MSKVSKDMINYTNDVEKVNYLGTDNLHILKKDRNKG
jgi:hypothetical protein